jgi:hypothetical protein
MCLLTCTFISKDGMESGSMMFRLSQTRIHGRTIASFG